jgi:hypothetical protein
MTRSENLNTRKKSYIHIPRYAEIVKDKAIKENATCRPDF